MAFSGFGSGGFGSNNQNNNNNSSSPFGGGGFGSNANTGFGSGSTTGGGFGSGGFGTNNQTSAFGNASRPFGGGTTGGGLFGNSNNQNTSASGLSSGTFGTSNQNQGGFGSSNTGGSLFGGGGGGASGGGASGGAANQPSSFGGGNSGGGGLFGSTSNTNTGGGFGNATNNSPFGSGTGGSSFGNASQNTSNTGTGGTPFTAVTERDGVNAQVAYQSLTFQQPYQNHSFEELRVADYVQGRKYGNQSGQPGAFGVGSSFGGATNNTGGFGGFGSNNNANTSSGGLFGSQQNNNSQGGFGSNNNSGGLLGQNKPAASSLFGGTPNTTNSQQSGGGLFGSTGGGGFNNNNANTSSTGGGIFGSAQNKPASSFGNSGFGNTNQQPSGFGNNNQGSGLFGQQNTQQPQGGGLFGGNTTQSNQNQSGGSGLFGGGSLGANNNANNNQSKGLFGNTNNTGSSLFGGGNNQQPQSQPAGGLFGNNNNNNQQQSGGGLFGAKPAGQANGLFGAPQNNNNNTGGGLFGGANSSNQPQQNSGGGLFGNAANNQQKPGLFGATTTANNTSGGGGLFGGLNTSNNNQQPQQQPQAGMSLFGNSGQQQPQQTNGLLGNSQQAQTQQSQSPQHLTTSIHSPTPYGFDSLFADLGTPQQPVGPVVTPLSSSQRPRQRAPLPPYRISPAASMRLVTPQKRTGYGFSYSTYGTPGSAYSTPGSSGSLFSNGNRYLNKSRSTSSLRTTNDSENRIFNPTTFLTRAQHSSGSMKRLHIDRSLRIDRNLFGDSKPSPLKKSVTFDEESSPPRAIEGPTTNGESSRALVRVDDQDSATPEGEALDGTNGASPTTTQTNGVPASKKNGYVRGKELAIVPENEAEYVSQADQTPGDYLLFPSIAELEKLSPEEKSAYKGLVVARMGVGHVEFEEVNLNEIELEGLIGRDVVLDVRAVTVYPDPNNKPPPGTGLNVPATITLGNSWAKARGGKLPVHENKGPRFEKHLRRLKSVPNTEFIEYRHTTGEWVFRVQHFSTYALHYEDDVDMSSTMLSAPLDYLEDADEEIPFGNSMLSNGSYGQSSSNLEDTFEFRRSKPPPGAFDDVDMMNAGGASQSVTEDISKQTMSQQSATSNSGAFGSSKMVGSFPGLDGTVEYDVVKHSPSAAASIRPKSILKNSQRQPSIFGSPPAGRMSGNADWVEQLQRTLSPKKQDRQALRESQGVFLHQDAPQPKNAAPASDSKHFATSVDIMNSLFGKASGSTEFKKGKQSVDTKDFKWPFAKRTKTSADPNTMNQFDKLFHMSFKPTWTSDGRLVTTPKNETGQRNATNASAQPAEVDIAEVFPRPTSSQTFEKQKQLTTFEIEDGVPHARMMDSFSFADFSSAMDVTDSSTQDEKNMWSLAQILFDSQDSKLDQRSVELLRKHNLTQYWKSIVIQDGLEQARHAGSAEEKAIAYLSTFDVWNATEALLQGRDFRLGTMIAQIGGDEVMRQGITDQIDQWRETNALSEIPNPIRALYEILAGNTCVSEGSKPGAGPENKAERFGIAAHFDLDWRRAFGLKLWYGTIAEESLSKAVELFAHDLGTYIERVRPIPPFVSPVDAAKSEQQDILWGLLKIYARSHPFGDDRDRVSFNLGSVFAPENLSKNPLDARLSFQLFQALRARGIIDFDIDSHEEDEEGNVVLADHKADLLTNTFLASLSQSADSLPSAAFVALHLSSPGARASTVRSLLARHAAALSTDKTSSTFSYLVDELLIPEAWIWSAKAQHAACVPGGDPYEQTICLLNAGDIVGAHNVLCHVLGPRCVIEQEHTRLRKVIRMFEGEVPLSDGVKPRAGTSAKDKLGRGTWRTGGEVFADYAFIVDMVGAKVQVEKNREVGRRILDRLPGWEEWKRMGLEERVAMHEMGDIVKRALNEEKTEDERKKAGQPRTARDYAMDLDAPAFGNFQDNNLVGTKDMVEEFQRRLVKA
ncbi:MAG: Nuclear pore complex protein Nup98-Nup96 [Alyxoria varia]|nr:MAG: Nuclear pore complex protein Nup98-Nup96 [Alyxoria varia]